jgi:hypothetical protein
VWLPLAPIYSRRKKLASSLRNPARDSGESLFLLLIGRLEVQKQSENEAGARPRGDERRKTWLMR